MPTRTKADIYFINTTFRDMEVYGGRFPRSEPTNANQLLSEFRQLPQSNSSYGELMLHFHDVGYLSLVVFGMDPTLLRDQIVRIATTDSATTTTLAVLYALLAFSSLRVNGYQEQAIELKIRALELLSASVRVKSMSMTEAAPHIAASMLLASFQMMVPSEGSTEWSSYIRGSLEIVGVTALECQAGNEDISLLLDWLDYHHSMAHFSSHERHQMALTQAKSYSEVSGQQKLECSILSRYKPALPAPDSTYVVSNLLAEIYNNFFDPWAHNEEHHSRCTALEDKIARLPIMAVSATFGANDALPTQVYQMAVRIYYARASKSAWKLSAAINTLIDNVFAGPLPEHACGHFFPVFIVACEAATDKRRRAVLGLLDSAGRNGRLRGVKALRHEIQHIWVQQDLGANSELLVNYLEMMGAVVSTGNVSSPIYERLGR